VLIQRASSSVYISAHLLFVADAVTEHRITWQCGPVCWH